MKSWPAFDKALLLDEANAPPKVRITGKKKVSNAIQERIDASDSDFLQSLAGNAFSAQCCLFSICTLGTVLGWLSEERKSAWAAAADAKLKADAMKTSPSSSSTRSQAGIQRTVSHLFKDISDTDRSSDSERVNYSAA